LCYIIILIGKSSFQAFIVKGGRLPGWVKKVADCLYIRPVLSIKENGSMGASGVIRGISNLPEKMSKLVLGKMDPKNQMKLAIMFANDDRLPDKAPDMVENIHQIIDATLLQYGSIDNIPYSLIVQDIAACQVRPKRRGKK